jgi:hypothetical protein
MGKIRLTFWQFNSGESKVTISKNKTKEVLLLVAIKGDFSTSRMLMSFALFY